MTQNQVDELIALSNPYPNRDYQVQCSTPELTCVCPVTGQPDFGTVTMTYVPDQSIVELKSLKIYLGKFRDQGHDSTHEAPSDCPPAGHRNLRNTGP